MMMPSGNENRQLKNCQKSKIIIVATVIAVILVFAAAVHTVETPLDKSPHPDILREKIETYKKFKEKYEDKDFELNSYRVNRTRLTDANHAGISLESRFDLAYEALLQLAVTALRANHLRVTSRGGHHALAMQTLDSSIGYPREKVGVQGDLFEPMTRAPRGANERRADVRREGIRSMP